MKRYQWMGIMLSLVLLLCSCGTDKEVEKKAGESTSTPSATASVTPLISEDEAFSEAEKIVKTMTIEQKVGQMFLVDLLQLDASPSVDGTAYKATDSVKQAIIDYHLGGVYLTKENIKSQKQTKKLVQNLQASVVSGSALYVAVEEDGGGENSISAKVEDLKDTGYVAPKEMGQNMTANQIYESGKTIAGELTKIGINLNLAPVADLASDQNPSYAMRCLGSDADGVADLLDDFVSGMREGGLSVTLKTFPGIGNVSADVTESIAENTDSLMTIRDTNFVPYASGIQAGADCVMVSNVAYSKLTVKKVPAFMSQDIVTKLLREELGFDGIVMTSPLNDNVIENNYTNEFAVVEAVKAGCDLIVLPGNFKECYEALITAVEEGRIDEKVINTSVRRILQNKIQRGILVLE